MKSIKTQIILFDMDEVKALTGFTLKNSRGNYVLEHEQYGVIHDIIDGEESFTKNKLFEYYMAELEDALRHYIYNNLLGDYHYIIKNSRFEYDTVEYPVQFNSNNPVSVYFIFEDEDYLELTDNGK